MRTINVRIGNSVDELRQTIRQLILAIQPYLTNTISLLEPPLELLADGGGLLLHDGGEYKTGNLPYHPQSLLLANRKPLLWADGREALQMDSRKEDAEAEATTALTTLGVVRPRVKLESELTVAAPIGSATASV